MLRKEYIAHTSFHHRWRHLFWQLGRWHLIPYDWCAYNVVIDGRLRVLRSSLDAQHHHSVAIRGVSQHILSLKFVDRVLLHSRDGRGHDRRLSVLLQIWQSP